MNRPIFTPDTAGHDSIGSHPFDIPKPGTNRPGQRVLLVDDDPIVRNSLNDVLVAEGYFAIPAENGRQALDLVHKMPVDLVLLDLNMPVKNGWDTLAELKRDYPMIPVIVLTARPNQFSNVISAGAAALMEKPMDVIVLLQTMNRLLGKRCAEMTKKDQILPQGGDASPSSS